MKFINLLITGLLSFNFLFTPVSANEIKDKIDVKMSLKDYSDTEVALDTDIINLSDETIETVGVYQKYNVPASGSEKREMEGFDFQYSIISDDKLLQYRANTKLKGSGKYRTLFKKEDLKDGLEITYSIHNYLQPDDETLESNKPEYFLEKGVIQPTLTLEIGDTYSRQTGLVKLSKTKTEETIKTNKPEESEDMGNKFSKFLIPTIIGVSVVVIGAIIIYKKIE